MPSKSKAQHNLMAMVANDPKAAKRLGIPQSVGEEYMKADKGKKYAMGGKVGMHKMPDGTMMKDSEHKMMGGGKAMYKAGGKVRGAGMAMKGVRSCKMV